MGHRTDPWSGNKIPHATRQLSLCATTRERSSLTAMKTQHSQKKKKKGIHDCDSRLPPSWKWGCVARETAPEEFWEIFYAYKGFPSGSDGIESACNAGDLDLIPGLVRSPGEKNGYPLQYSCLENSMDRGAWRATVHGSQRVRQQLTLSLYAYKVC